MASALDSQNKKQVEKKQQRPIVDVRLHSIYIYIYTYMYIYYIHIPGGVMHQLVSTITTHLSSLNVAVS